MECTEEPSVFTQIVNNHLLSRGVQGWWKQASSAGKLCGCSWTGDEAAGHAASSSSSLQGDGNKKHTHKADERIWTGLPSPPHTDSLERLLKSSWLLRQLSSAVPADRYLTVWMAKENHKAKEQWGFSQCHHLSASQTSPPARPGAVTLEPHQSELLRSSNEFFEKRRIKLQRSSHWNSAETKTSSRRTF